jgi:hypothetical protein
MRPPRFTIAKLMGTVASAAILLAVFRLGSFAGLVALVPLGITALIARLSAGPSASRQALWVGAAGTLLLPFLAAIWINQQLWGFFVSRPAVDRRIVNARQIETVTRVETGSDSPGGRMFTGLPVGEVGSFIQVHPQEGDYYVLEGRILRELTDRQALPAEPRIMPAGRLEGLYQVLEATGWLEDGEPGYADAKRLSGIVVEALDQDGRPLLFVGVCGGEVSNDHHPYYEFLFTTDSLGAPAKLLSSQRFYYDVAGIEGLEWPVFLPAFAWFSLIPTLPIQGFLLWRARRRERVRSDDPTGKTATPEPDTRGRDV